jgi:hypothetical protein
MVDQDVIGVGSRQISWGKVSTAEVDRRSSQYDVLEKAAEVSC